MTSFHGNTSVTDHFKLLKEDGASVLVGARNIIYNLSLPDLQEYTEQVLKIFHNLMFLMSVMLCKELCTPFVTYDIF